MEEIEVQSVHNGKSKDFNSIHSSYVLDVWHHARQSAEKNNRPLPSRAHRLAESEFRNLSLSSFTSFEHLLRTRHWRHHRK